MELKIIVFLCFQRKKKKKTELLFKDHKGHLNVSKMLNKTLLVLMFSFFIHKKLGPLRPNGT